MLNALVGWIRSLRDFHNHLPPGGHDPRQMCRQRRQPQQRLQPRPLHGGVGHVRLQRSQHRRQELLRQRSSAGHRVAGTDLHSRDRCRLLHEGRQLLSGHATQCCHTALRINGMEGDQG